MPLPLEEWRVVDLTDLQGAMCGRMLADVGAQVVKITGHQPPVADSDKVAAIFRDAGKTLVELDFTRPEGRAALETLLAGADVVVENLSQAARRSYGLEPAAVQERHPHLIHVAMAGFGLEGPRSEWLIDPLTAQAAGGTLFASGFADRPPCWFPGFLGPDCASVYAFTSTVAALVDRRRHGRGQTVEVAVQEAVLAGTTPWSVVVNDYLKINPFLPAKGTRAADGFYWVFPASDGWVRTVIGNPKQWNGFVDLLHRPEVLAGPEWADSFYRRVNADVARMVSAELLKDRTRAELFEEARALGATLGLIHLPSEFVAHPQTRFRDVFVPSLLEGVEGGPEVRPPLRLAASPGRDHAEPARRGAAPDWAERPAPPAEASPRPPLLEGVRVVEFGMAAVGPEASLVLSEFGADVIKIESSVHLDVLRLSGFDRINCGFAFNNECRGRRSVNLNLATEEGRRLALELCHRADVVVENYRGGVLDEMGLGYEDVRAGNPRVVYASTTGYGRGGPLGNQAAYGPLNLGFVGLHHLWNHPDVEYPCGTSLNHPDHVAGKFLASSILLALDHRERTGEGQRIDMAQTDLAAYLRGEVYLEAWLSGQDPQANGNASPSACPHGVFPSAGEDEWIAVSVHDDGAWAAFLSVAGLDPDPALAGVAARLAERARVEAMVSAWTAGLAPADAAVRLQAAGVVACPVMGPLDQLADEHLLARGAFDILEHPEVGEERHTASPVRMSRTVQRRPGPAPCLGADTVEVLGEVLGLGEADVAALVEAGVCI